eukprot:COSAG02_NODE_34277_length_486_cov_1.201550_1_plen_36_part_10
MEEGGGVCVYSLSLLYAIQFPVAGTKNTPLSLSTWA